MTVVKLQNKELHKFPFKCTNFLYLFFCFNRVSFQYRTWKKFTYQVVLNYFPCVVLEILIPFFPYKSKMKYGEFICFCKDRIETTGGLDRVLKRHPISYSICWWNYLHYSRTKLISSLLWQHRFDFSWALIRYSPRTCAYN